MYNRLCHSACMNEDYKQILFTHHFFCTTPLSPLHAWPHVGGGLTCNGVVIAHAYMHTCTGMDTHHYPISLYVPATFLRSLLHSIIIHLDTAECNTGP